MEEFKPQTEIERATWGERAWLMLDRWVAGRSGRATVNEYAVNTLIGDSFGINNRMGDSDKTEQNQARNRWSRLEDLRKKYKGEADRGNQVVGAITDFHAALQGGMGLRHKDIKGDADNPSDEFNIWKEFLKDNDLDDQGLVDLAVIGELEGQILMRLEEDIRMNGNRGGVRAWPVPLLETRYKVVHDRFNIPDVAILNPEGYNNTNEERVFQDSFAFVRFRGIKNGSYGIARLARILDELDELDDAIRDWRKINRINASPTPIFQAKDNEGIKRIVAAIRSINWKIGKAFVMLAEDDFKLVSMPAGATDSLEKEIIKKAQFIAGAANIPVNYLGFPELQSNRSVADSDMEPPIKSTQKAHGQLKEFIDDIKRKVFAFYSVMHGKAYDPDAVECSFPAIQKGNIAEAIKSWLPAAVAKTDGRPLISRRTFHSNVGIDDPESEEVQIDKELEKYANSEDIDPEEEAAILSLLDDEGSRQEGAA